MKQFFYTIFLSIFFIPASAMAVFPNDPVYGQWSYDMLGLEEAWDITVGSKNVVVAIIDNGFDTDHPDLRNNVWVNKGEIKGNKIDDDGNGYVDDIHGWNYVPQDLNGNEKIDAQEKRGNNDIRPRIDDPSDIDEISVHHGTVVAGIIGGQGNNKKFGAGVNWNVQLMGLKVLDEGGRGYVESLDDAILYAVDNGADIINFSLVSSDIDGDIQNALRYAREKGVLLVAAAGNDRDSLNEYPRYPICADASQEDPYVIGVSAIDQQRRLATFSNYGSECIDITAPGVNIGSTIYKNDNAGLTKSYSDGWNGTSFATPFVSGAAALVKSVQPTWKAEEITRALFSSVYKTPPANEDVYANLYGNGLLQVNKAVEFAYDRLSRTKKDSLDTPEKKQEVPEESIQEEQDRPMSKNIEQVKELQFLRTDGEPFVYNLSEKTSQKQESVIDQFDSVFAVEDLAVTVSFARGQANVQVYKKFTQLVQEWAVSSEGKVKVLAKDLLSYPGVEIVLVPQYITNKVYSVYSEQGIHLYSVYAKTPHVGVSAAFGEDNSVITVYNQEGRIEFYQYDERGQEMHMFPVTDFTTHGPIASADIDGDGEYEVVISSGPIDGGYLGYYELDGQLKRKFIANSFGKVTETEIFIADVDGDGKHDVLFYPIDGSASIRAWSYRSRKVGEYPMDALKHSSHYLFIL